MANSFAILGATGLVGSNIFKYLLQSPTPNTIMTLTRRALDESPIVAMVTRPADHTITEPVEPDTSKWPAAFGDLCKSTSPPPVVFTGLGTTRAAAGGIEKQYAIEHDINVDVAKAAKEAGVKTFVLISARNASPTSRIAYSKLKGDIEASIEAVGFERYIIVRPGWLLGPRTDQRHVEGFLQLIARGLASVSTSLVDSFAQHAEVVARAAVRAALDESIKGKKILEQADIVKLGTKEDS
ncbi:hypothetical protein DRE_03904 [Drechslerella stenobrocha 248]|uniref:NAD(P)-binding domain-containing protein n=1 Tax=Drechslerella stenobrocha 248 TaxID=1043628 RepID=W7I3C1_9PEZI|nr:hypothetical protein DRE_03904 [Drechslerella stenobrocha 248]